MTLRRSTQIYLESELSNYKYIDKDIARVREVLNPWQPTDTNIGGEHVQYKRYGDKSDKSSK